MGYLRRDVRQHLQLTRTRQDAVAAQLRKLLGDPIQHRDVLGEYLAVVEYERGYVTFWIDGEEILTGCRPLGAEVYSFGFEFCAYFKQGDMIGEAACVRGIVEFHH